ncbi:hypothetical protein ANCCAN_18886 [Ancylostoma caninum]|nr:hypothetical protein ANCCAN_18886 [Ancylostoma caninum]
MSKMEERLKLHNEKLMETLRHQKEEREKRRRSFHEVSKFFFAYAQSLPPWICAIMDSTEEQQPVVRMRGRPLNETNGTNATNGTNGAQNALQRGLEALQENCSEETEEIRKLDSQLDHLNDYMSKMEERLKLHNEKLMETLRHQKEEREKRRRSFHERMTQNQAEDTAFQQQMASILNRVDSVRNRQSIFDIVNNMDIPKVNNV